MRSQRLLLAASGVAILIAAASQAAGSTFAGIAKPVIGPAVAVPKVALAGKPMVVAFKVTRKDTGAPLRSGKMVCDPSVAGKVIAHAESFMGGVARLAFTVPANAAGRNVVVKLRIVSGSTSATRVATFKVQASAPPTLSIGDASVAEGNAGTTTMSFRVGLSTRAAGPVTVTYATSDGTATTPADYASASGTLTFGVGETAKTIAVSVVGDLLMEPDESFTVTLANPVGASLGTATATGRITNDDTAVPVTTGSYKGATQNGNYVFFTVTPDRTVTLFRVNDLPETCPGWKITGGSNWGKDVWPIGADGTFRDVGTWSGRDPSGEIVWTNWSAEVNGTISGGTARGTVLEKLEFDYRSTHVACTSGLITWTAAVQ